MLVKQPFERLTVSVGVTSENADAETLTPPGVRTKTHVLREMRDAAKRREWIDVSFLITEWTRLCIVSRPLDRESREVARIRGMMHRATA